MQRGADIAQSIPLAKRRRQIFRKPVMLGKHHVERRTHRAAHQLLRNALRERIYRHKRTQRRHPVVRLKHRRAHGNGKALALHLSKEAERRAAVHQVLHIRLIEKRDPTFAEIVESRHFRDHHTAPYHRGFRLGIHRENERADLPVGGIERRLDVSARLIGTRKMINKIARRINPQSMESLRALGADAEKPFHRRILPRFQRTPTHDPRLPAPNPQKRYLQAYFYF